MRSLPNSRLSHLFQICDHLLDRIPRYLFRGIKSIGILASRSRTDRIRRAYAHLSLEAEVHPEVRPNCLWKGPSDLRICGCCRICPRNYHHMAARQGFEWGAVREVSRYEGLWYTISKKKVLRVLDRFVERLSGDVRKEI